MRRSTLALLLVFLVIPNLVFASEARKRALAAGQIGFLYEDDSDIGLFPQSLAKHHRITLENVAPGGTVPEPAVGGYNETYGAASWEMWGGTVQWRVGFPTPSILHQRDTHEMLKSTAGYPADAPDAAHSAIDFGWANDGKGFNVQLGTESQVGLDGSTTDAADTKTLRNTALDVSAGMTTAGGMDVSAIVSMSSFGALYLDEQSKSAFRVGVAARKEMGLPFFNHWVAGGSFQKDVKASTRAADDAPSSFAASVDLFNYTMAGMDQAGGGEGVTYLLAVGVGFVSADTGDSGSDRRMTIQLPRATAGAEYDVTSWLAIRGSVNRDFNWTFVKDNNSSGASAISTTLGAGAHWGDFIIDAVLNNRMFESGPEFVGGNAAGLANYVTVTYKL